MHADAHASVDDGQRDDGQRTDGQRDDGDGRPLPRRLDGAVAAARVWWRDLQQELSGLTAGEQIFATVLGSYIVVVTVLRFWGALGEWASEGDWRQWIFQYWRYSVDGAFPPGELLTDYIFACQPPLYWLLMSTLSTFVTPLHAAFVVSVVAWAVLLFAIFAGVRGRTSALVALIAVAFFVREVEVFRWSAGGYPRSFGPALSAWFLAAWLNGRFGLAVAAIVVAAGLYPSVAVPCGLALGASTAFAIIGVVDVRQWRQRLLALGGAAVVLAVVGQLQNALAAPWWGPVVAIADTGIESTRHGRWTWAPLAPFWRSLRDPLGELVSRSGWATFEKSPVTLPDLTRPLEIVGALAVLAMVLVLLVRRRRALPWQLFVFFGASLVAYAVARAVAFRLYLPRRMVQHTLPILTTFLWPLLVVRVAEVFGAPLRRAALALAVSVAPVFVLAGDGLQTAGIFAEKSRWAPMYEWIRANTALTDRFAGDYQTMDWMPLYAWRPAYVNFTLAHPSRAGLFAEMRRRTLRTYDAYYATRLEDVLAFMDDEGVRWFVVDRALFAAVEDGWGRLFEPMRADVVKTFEQNRARGFALEAPPAEVVAFVGEEHRIIDRERLRAYLKR
jgi:hypothetical protein